MLRAHTRRRITCWTLALTLSAWVLPVLAASLWAGQRTTQWVEICTQQGMRVVPVAAGEPGAPASSHGALDHCPYCTLPDLLAPASTPPVQLGLARPQCPVAVAREPLRLADAFWSLPPARAPPALI